MSESGRGVDWNLLHVLHVLLEEGSVAAAAARLHVTSPAVSNALARLRTELGDPLFVRSGRGLVPTPRAVQLAATLGEGFSRLSRALHNELDPTTCTRTFVIALSDAEQLGSLAAVARAVARKLPRARLQVVNLDTLVSSGGLAGSAVDATIGPALGDDDGLHHMPLFTERAAFVVRRDHPRVRRTLDRALFEAEGHVDVHLLLGNAGSGHRAAEDAFQRAGLHRTIACVVPSFAAVASVVAATDLVGAMPRRVATLLARALPLRLVKAPCPELQFQMSLYWHERTHRDPANRAFRDAVRLALSAREEKSTRTRE